MKDVAIQGSVWEKISGLTHEQAEELHSLNFDNWKSSCTRNSMLWGHCEGNDEHENSFYYFGTPTVYRVVIINYDTGKTKISDVITRQQLDSHVTIDYNTMDVVFTSYRYIRTLVALVVTILVETLIGLIMKMKNTKIIITTNFISNLILQSILLFVPFTPYLAKFIIMEIFVVLFEFFIYRKFMKEQSKNKILLYTLIANITTALLTFL